MRSLQRRKQDLWICTASVIDTDIEGLTRYSKPVKFRATVSNTSGTPQETAAGIVPEYSRYFVSYDRNLVVNEGDVLFVDKIPQLTPSGALEVDINGNPYTKPDYVVTHIMDTARGTIARYGIRKVAGDES